jgi:hypothetical protein
VKTSWIPVPIPISRRFPNQQPVTVPGHDAGFLENCEDLQQCLIALAGKYSLDSSGGSTAQEDAARFNRKNNKSELEGVALISMDHKGSELTGIIRPRGIMTRETLKHIEIDTQDILNRWI